MSGVGITGLIEPLNGGSFPVFEDINGLGGFRAVLNVAARNAIPANFRKIGMVVADQTTGLSWQLVGGILDANWQRYADSPFRGTYYVDPNFTGTQTGSQSNPYTTCAAAFAAAVTSGIADGIIYLPPKTTLTENVTFPLTGEWELSGLLDVLSTAISGNVDISASASARRFLSHLQITGNLTGNTSAGNHRIFFDDVIVSGTTTFTISGSGSVSLFSPANISASGGFNTISDVVFSGALVVPGNVFLTNAAFASTVSVQGASTFAYCVFFATVTAGPKAATGDVRLAFDQCYLNGQSVNISNNNSSVVAAISATDSSFDSSTFTFTGTGINFFNIDSYTAQSFFAHGGSVVGVVAFSLKGVRRTGDVNNEGPFALASKSPFPMMRVNAALTLVTPGTAGAAVINIIYTDTLGVSRTKAVTPTLNIAGSAGDESSGSLLFTQNGAAAFTYSVTGIATPGALTYNLAISLEPAI